MRRLGALMLAIMLLFCACGSDTTETSQSTVVVSRPSTSVTSTSVTSETSLSTVITSATDATESTEQTTGTTTSATAAGSTITTTTTTIAGVATATATTTLAPTSSTQKTATTTTVTTATTTTTTTTTTAKPAPKPSVSGEVRGAWVSYIELTEVLQHCSTPEQAKTALDDMMSRMADCRINTVFFHVRANSDAYYKSSIFKPAVAAKRLLDAGFDPLAYAVESAHKRGMTLHAWVNPYRVGKDTTYLVKNVPTLTDQSGRYYYVPTSTDAQALILRGIREILENYDVDGIQYDDYFYPEGLLEENTVYGFESNDYVQYQENGGALTVGNWRRAGVDALIAGTHVLTSSHGVVFGVSPAVNADNTYKALYADCRKWLAEDGFVDYLCPQIYTGFEHGASPFDKMVDTWQSYPRHSSVDLYVGLALYKIGYRSDTYAGAGKTEWLNHDDVMKRSVEYSRSKQIKGICLYSYSYLYPQDKIISSLSQTNDVVVAKREVSNLLSIW